MDPDAAPCQAPGTNHVVLHDPDDVSLSTVPLAVCDEHLAAIAGTSKRTAPDLVKDWEASYGCPTCGKVSFNPMDIEMRYCGACHRFADSP
jgi:hypothetical protein